MAHAHTEQEHAVESPVAASEGNMVFLIVAALAMALASVAVGAKRSKHTPDAVAKAGVSSDSPRVARGRSFGVATAAPEASKAAAEILAKGGNAFDALVTASFVVSVVRPQSTGIGGGGFVLYHDVRTGKNGAIDGRECAPASARKDMYVDETGDVTEDYRHGPRAGGIPGIVAMLGEVYSTHASGKFSWSELLQPAIKYAEEGFRVPAPLATAIRAERKQLERWPASRLVFLPGGRAPKAGELFKQPQLARTLRAIAKQGARAFYTGWVATEMREAVNAAGGAWTSDDLSKFKVDLPDPVVGEYSGHTVVSMPPPSSGGTAIIQMLHMLSAYDLARMGHNTPETIHLLTEVMRRAFADRYAFVADPRFEPDPAAEELFRKRILQQSYADLQRASIDLHHASKSSDIRPREYLMPQESDHTTHLSIIDRYGNAVSSTQTVNTWLGSCFVLGATGIVLNNEMADFTAKVGVANPFGLQQGTQNLPQPHKRPMSSMSPTLLFGPNGKLEAAIGSPGGPKIINVVLQILLNLIDFKLSPQEAMDAPRIHHQWEPDTLRIENKLEDRVTALLAMGHRVQVLPPGVGLGNAQIVVVKDGERVAVSDWRGTGRPAAQ